MLRGVLFAAFETGNICSGTHGSIVSVEASRFSCRLRPTPFRHQNAHRMAWIHVPVE
jgi:hypothetical protein